MSNEELKAIRSVLNDARHEIQGLRRTNEILRAKVEVLEIFAPLIHTCFQRGGLMAPDVTHAIEKAILAISEHESKTTTQTE